MTRHRLGALVHLLRQGLAIEGEFGLEPLEALVQVALAVEASVYDPSSFVRTPSGLAFALWNPPLRCGAFSSVRVGVDGEPPTEDGLRVALGPCGPWREARAVSAPDPLHLRPGIRIRFEIDRAGLPHRGRHSLRLELRSTAIPPLVWLEVTDTPRPGGPPG